MADLDIGSILSSLSTEDINNLKNVADVKNAISTIQTTSEGMEKYF